MALTLYVDGDRWRSHLRRVHEVHPTVVWEKFKALRQGADLASKQLWGKN